GPCAASSLLTISDFSQKANFLIFARCSAAASASCSASSSSREGSADASNNVGALNVNSFIVFPPKVVSRRSTFHHGGWRAMHGAPDPFGGGGHFDMRDAVRRQGIRDGA